MTKPLRGFPPEVRTKIARGRLTCQTRGLGYLSALDYLNKVQPAKAVKIPEISHKEEDYDECPQEQREIVFKDARAEP